MTGSAEVYHPPPHCRRFPLVKWGGSSKMTGETPDCSYPAAATGLWTHHKCVLVHFQEKLEHCFLFARGFFAEPRKRLLWIRIDKTLIVVDGGRKELSSITLHLNAVAVCE